MGLIPRFEGMHLRKWASRIGPDSHAGHLLYRQFEVQLF